MKTFRSRPTYRYTSSKQSLNPTKAYRCSLILFNRLFRCLAAACNGRLLSPMLSRNAIGG